MRKILFKILPILIVVVMFSNCSKLEDFGSTNQNPGTTPTPVTSALLTQTLAGIGNLSVVMAQGLYCQYYSETQYTEVSLYNTQNASSTAIYSGRLMDLQNIINQNTDLATKATATESGSNADQIAIARILKAYIYWYVTDTWGDVPYSDALKGTPFVTYDRQDSIYPHLITELTLAVAQFDNGLPIKGDIVYGGDTGKWKKFANSLRALMALRLTKKTGATLTYAQTEFAAAIADPAGVIESNADNFALTYIGNNYKHPWYNVYDGRKDYGESNTMVSVMSGDNRQSMFGTSNVGVPYGRLRDYMTVWTEANPNWSYVLKASLRDGASSLVMIGAANVFAARAEAAQLGWTAEVAQTMYQNGIDASFTQWGLAAPGPKTLTVGQEILDIHLEQYKAFYPNGWQGWANWRRTSTNATPAGVPALTPAVDGLTSAIHRRYMYGTNELTLTKEACAVAISRLPGGQNTNSARVWWDQE